jgi:hypothetical protein
MNQLAPIAAAAWTWLRDVLEPMGSDNPGPSVRDWIAAGAHRFRALPPAAQIDALALLGVVHDSTRALADDTPEQVEERQGQIVNLMIACADITPDGELYLGLAERKQSAVESNMAELHRRLSAAWPGPLYPTGLSEPS